MGILIALLIIFFVLPYVFRPLVMWWLKRKIQKRFGDAFNGYGAPQDMPKERKAGWSQAPAAKKKIDATAGEYVKFEDVKVETTVTDAEGQKDTRFVAEQQIVDVEWEDIK